jgi:hypothetical protein
LTVFKKIVIVKITDPNKPTKDFELYLRQPENKGIDTVLLGLSAGIKEATFKFVCSDRNPSNPKTMEDIDRLLSEFNIKILQETTSHKNDPSSNGSANHSVQIDTNLDDPSLDDKFISSAKNIHEEQLTKYNIKKINEKREFLNKLKQQTESSDDDTDKIKLLDENKTTVITGEIERG